MNKKIFEPFLDTISIQNQLAAHHFERGNYGVAKKHLEHAHYTLGIVYELMGLDFKESDIRNIKPSEKDEGT